MSSDSAVPPSDAAPATPPADKLPSIGGLFADTALLYKKRIGTFFMIFLCGIGYGVLAGLVMVACAFGLKYVDPGVRTAAVALYFLLSFFLIATVVCKIQIAVLAACLDDCGWRDALERSKGRAFSFLWTGYLAAIILFGSALLFILPALVFAVWLFFAGCSFVAEDTKGASALLRSRELVRGRFWQVFLRLVIVNAGVMALSAIPIAGVVLWIFLMPFNVMYVCTLFKHLRGGSVPSEYSGKDKLRLFGAPIAALLAVPAVLFVVAGPAVKAWGEEFAREIQKRVSLSSSGSSAGMPKMAMPKFQMPSLGAKSGSAAPPPDAFRPEDADPVVPQPVKAAAQKQPLKRVTLKNGHQIDGVIVERDANGFWLDPGGGARVYVKDSEVEGTRDE